MTTRPLVTAILLSAGLVGFLNYKLKARLDEKQLGQMTQVFTNTATWQGQIAPDFELVTVRGDRFQLSESIGKKVIVLNFFATWCDPCRAEMPELNRYFNEHRSDAVLLGIDSDERQSLVESFLDELNLDFPVGIDPGAIQKQYNVTALPTTVLIGVDGKIQFYEAGGLSNPEVAFDNFLHLNRNLLGSGRAISPEEYRQQSLSHPSLPAPPPKPTSSNKGDNSGAADNDDFRLDARAQRIAARMGCPCGCAQTVRACICSTSKKIKKALATENFENTPDDQIIRGLNNRFCVGPSGQM